MKKISRGGFEKRKTKREKGGKCEGRAQERICNKGEDSV